MNSTSYIIKLVWQDSLNNTDYNCESIMNQNNLKQQKLYKLQNALVKKHVIITLEQ